jgi:hypothetical protein
MTYGVWTGVALWLGLSAAVVAWRPRVTRSVRTIAAPLQTRHRRG